MVVRNIVKRNFFRDSLQLLRISEKAKEIEGITDAAVVMGTETNKEILEKLGLLLDEGRKATKDDMIIAVSSEKEEAIEKAIPEIEEMLLKATVTEEKVFYGLESALEELPDANLAVVSVPGEHAREVVMKLLEKGIHVHLFSNHVPVEHEKEMKEYAVRKGLLVMGPGAGTSIINNKAIAFASAVSKGPVGIVAAAGTGLQEVSNLLETCGVGISQAIGVGGGDVKQPVNGLMTIEAIKALEKHEGTRVIGIVSKPPDQVVQEKIMAFIAAETKKNYVACFLGARRPVIPSSARERLRFARTLHSSVLQITKLMGEKTYREAYKRISMDPRKLLRESEDMIFELEEKQQYIRGLFTGGTFTYETLILLKELVGDVYSNAPLEEKLRLKNPYKSYKHTVVDLGEEEFTRGRAHPMIDPTIRVIRLVDEAKDPETAVIIMDFVLGYGSHPDPVGKHLEAIKEAREIAEEKGKYLPILAHVCGIERDPQVLSKQVKKLESLDVKVLPTNALMAVLAGLIALKGKMDESQMNKFFEEYLAVEGE